MAQPTLEIAEYLVAQGAHCFLKDSNGYSPVDYALLSCRSDGLVKFLLKQDPDPLNKHPLFKTKQKSLIPCKNITSI